MVIVTVSPTYQIVIPKPIRDRMKLAPGQRLQVITHEDRLELIPLRPMDELRGFLRGIEGAADREHDRP
ncbi:AbrB/MazE/SpoVT family DNA-binding domain-containing protein [Candidatus Fermentibacteria bacterium]|nr:AbrB/MazE/SpoVT family DNA-binding domain-containing protein [Candidatus Fermentibacteria bacterium]